MFLLLVFFLVTYNSINLMNIKISKNTHVKYFNRNLSAIKNFNTKYFTTNSKV